MSSMQANRLLSEDKVNFYRENGFVQIDNVLSPEELAELRQYVEEAMTVEDGLSYQADKKGGAYYKVLNQKVSTWRDHPGMGKYVCHPRFAQLALELTGAKAIRFFHDHALWKMPGDSKATPWHQDAPYWPMKETEALSIWIALDDVDEHNGCLQFVPTSHTVGKLKGIDFLNPQDINEYIKGSEVTKQQPVMVRMKAGSCTFHNGLTFHAANANTTDKPRRALAIIYFPDGTIYDGKAHPATDGLGLAADRPLAGRMFPVLARQ